jgi:hypothetical protein
MGAVMKRVLRVPSLLVLVGLPVLGCGSPSDEAVGEPASGAGAPGASGNASGGGSSAGSGGGVGAGGASGSGAASASGGVPDPGDGGLDDASAGSGSGGSLPTGIEFEYDPSKDLVPDACASVEIDAEEVFLDIFVILDQSGSMTQPLGNNDSDGYCDIGDPNVGSRWCNAINAMYSFFADPTTVGTGVSYAEFEDTGCDAFAMDVPFGILEAGDGNGQLSSLVNAMNDDDPGGATNTEGAIKTLIAETSAHVPTGTRKTIGILITDGAPNGCEEDLQVLNTLLTTHYVDNGIPTFIIGMDGVSADNLDALATGAGAEVHTDYCIAPDPECSYYSVGNGDPQAFIAALESIRKSVLGCEYQVPSASVGVGNLDTLDVRFKPSATDAALNLDRVDDEAACSTASEFWVDFNAGADPIVKLCPATCDLRGDGASIDIALTCEGS